MTRSWVSWQILLVLTLAKTSSTYKPYKVTLLRPSNVSLVSNPPSMVGLAQNYLQICTLLLILHPSTSTLHLKQMLPISPFVFLLMELPHIPILAKKSSPSQLSLPLKRIMSTQALTSFELCLILLTAMYQMLTKLLQPLRLAPLVGTPQCRPTISSISWWRKTVSLPPTLSARIISHSLLPTTQ